MKTFNEDDELTVSHLQTVSHTTAVEKGWWEDIDPGKMMSGGPWILEKIALVHSELSEAVEAYRDRGHVPGGLAWYREDGKPEGIPSELADAVIRIFDLASALGIDMATALVEKTNYNDGRPHRHGGKLA